jgi:hypothetical protein
MRVALARRATARAQGPLAGCEDMADGLERWRPLTALAFHEASLGCDSRSAIHSLKVGN